MSSASRPKTSLLSSKQAHHSKGRLGARPQRTTAETPSHGVQPLQPSAGRDGLIYNREFDGPHSVPRSIAWEAVTWLMQ
jgi:hypothetical protein